MLHLTRARLSSDARVGALLPLLRPRGDAARAHALVWSLMSDGSERRRDFLFRHGDDGALYVLSERAPEISPLWDAETIEAPRFEAGDVVLFTLRCSPVVRRKRPDGRTVKRDPVLESLSKLPERERRSRRIETTTAVVRDWLSGLGASGGYRLEYVAVEGYRQQRVRRPEGTAMISIADVSGVLTVTDAAAFASRVRDGFGTARAWGCGLMLTRAI